MRIGFIGNQNNYPFMLARGLRRRGHDVRVVIDAHHALDRPECRYADVSHPYPDWIREVPPVQLADVVFQTDLWRNAQRAVGDCDALVLNTWAFDAATRSPLPAICMSTGSDVEFWSNPSAAERFACANDQRTPAQDWVRRAMSMHRLDVATLLSIVNTSPSVVRRSFSKWLFKQFAARQRAGLKRAVAVNALPDGVSPGMAQVLHECIRPGVPRLHILMADIDWIRPSPPASNPTLRVFNGARILWKQPFPPVVGDWENKGTDVVLRGVALWMQRTGRSIDLRLVEKGPSVSATKQLVHELRLGAVVSWQRELTQAEVFEEYVRADIVTEQCGSHVLGMAGYEAMAAARPVIANGRPDLYAPLPMGVPPVAHAATPEDVALQLDRLSDPAERARLGEAGRRFVEQHLSVDGAAREVEAVLEHAIQERSLRASGVSYATPSPARTQAQRGIPSPRHTTAP